MRTNLSILILITLTMVIFSGCSFSGKNVYPKNINKEYNSYSSKTTSYSAHTKLVKHYDKFKGTRYCYGGNGTRCFDCSGFVNYTYKALFSTKLSRSTKAMASNGKWVSKRALQAGDLVFFKPGRYPRHVGIYVGGGQFIHASTSRGVIKSNLNESYWKRHYWMARRVM